MNSEKGYRLLSYYVSVLKENIHLMGKVSIGYCKAVKMERLHTTVRPNPFKKYNMIK